MGRDHHWKPILNHHIYILVKIVPDDICSVIKTMKLGKACGGDGLASEHFIYTGNSLHVLLAMLFSTFLSPLLCESPKGVFAKYIGQYRLSVCYFAKARRAFSQSILVSTVCLSVCLFVCLSVCLFVCLSVCLSRLLQATVLHRSRLFFYRRFGIPS